MRTGTANLPLHGGKAPRWLFTKMTRLAREIAVHIVSEYEAAELLRRLSDPHWFQAFGCVLGFDWHSSGVTTTTCGALKEGLKELQHDLGFYVNGGKGGRSRHTPQEIETACMTLGLDAQPLVYASKMSAKVDSAAVQDGYQLYHHCFCFTNSGDWCVIQQGMCDGNGMARRYHWRGDLVKNFVIEPQAAICCDARQPTLNLVGEENDPVRQRTAELVREPSLETLFALEQLPALNLPRRHPVIPQEDINPEFVRKVLISTYDQPPQDFEQLLGAKGVGAKTLRALTLVSELIYGTEASVRDPARFSFAHGGKDGIPFPVDRETYEATIDVLHTAINKASVDRSDKVKAFRRLASWRQDG